jgi:metal-dependent hydrolase (beta-lactamase superfamily II)
VRLGYEPQDVRVEATAQPLVGGDHDRADAPHVLAHREERVAVLGVGLGDVHRDLESAQEIRPRCAHAVLGLFHLRGRDHFHRLGDLARALHALDLVPDLFRARHCSS